MQASSSARPQVWSVFVGFLGALVLMLVGNVALLGVAAVATGRGASGVDRFVTSLVGISASAVVTVTCLGAISIGAGVVSHQPLAARLRLGPGRLGAPAIAAASFASMGASVAFSLGCDLAGLKEGGVLAEVTRAVLEAPSVHFVGALLALAVGPALGEEIFFRGFAQTRLEARWGRWVAIAIASALFGLVHLDPKQGSFAFAAGLWLGFVASRAGSVRPSMIVHCANNAGSLLLARFGLAPASTGGKAAMCGAALVVMALGIVGTILQSRDRDGGDHSRNVA